MPKTIVDIIEDVKQQELEYGIKEYSVYNNEKNYYNPILKFFHDHDAELYCPEILQQYYEMISQKHENSEVSDHRFRDIKRCIKRIRSCAETGSVDFTKNHPKTYQPSENGMNLYADILEFHHCAENISNNNQAILRNFICYLEQKGIALQDISDNVIMDFIDAAKTTYRQSNGYIRQSMVLVSDYLKSQGICLKMNYRELQMKGRRERMIEPFTVDEISRILSSIDAGSKTGIRDKAIILLAYSTGLRAIDITSLHLTDIDYKKGSVSVVQSKTGQPVFLPLNASTMNAVADYILKERPDSDDTHIFLSSRAPFNPLRGSESPGNISRKYCRIAEIEKKPGRDFHSFRRSFASGMSSAEIPLTIISQMLGHTGINSDKPYLSYNEKQMQLCALDFSDIPLTDGIYAKEGDGA